jgi:hypothetical protein
LAYQPLVSSTFLSQQIRHQQSGSSTFLSEQISTSHQSPIKRTGCQLVWCLGGHYCACALFSSFPPYGIATQNFSASTVGRWCARAPWLARTRASRSSRFTWLSPESRRRSGVDATSGPDGGRTGRSVRDASRRCRGYWSPPRPRTSLTGDSSRVNVIRLMMLVSSLGVVGLVAVDADASTDDGLSDLRRRARNRAARVATGVWCTWFGWLEVPTRTQLPSPNPN